MSVHNLCCPSLAGTSLCTQFRDSLRDLVEQISMTTPHYIRCLKPNDEHVKQLFDAR